jgi:signal transduction histidine kinase
VRTPLHGVLSASEALSEMKLSTEAREECDTIESCSRILMSLLTNVLDFASSRDSPALADATATDAIDVEKLTRDVTRLGQQLCSRAGLRFAIHVKGEPPVQVGLREGDLFQVFGNLIGNAAKFTPPGGSVVVELFWEAVPGELAISFIDSGPGVPPHMRARVFEPFERGMFSGLTHEGIGLGLSIVKRVVEGGLGGTVKCLERGDGLSGAHFLVKIPYQRVEQFSTATSEGKLAHVAIPTSVLIIDDNSLNLSILKRALTRAGVKSVATASSGKEALRVLEADSSAGQFDGIFCDVFMRTYLALTGSVFPDF